MALRQWLVRGRVLALAAVVAALVGARAAAEDAVEARMRKDITFLASDECEGRGVTTKGIQLAAEFIAAEFKKAGLKPGGPDGSYFQPFSISGRGNLEPPTLLRLRGPQGQEVELKLNEHFQPLGLSGSGKVTAPLVFLGYGATATNPHAPYDDYKGVDVAGKIVVLVRRTPRYTNEDQPFDGSADLRDHHAALVTKMVLADQHKAAGVVFVSDRANAGPSDALLRFRDMSRDGSGAVIPAVHVKRSVIDSLLRSARGTTLAEVEQDIDRDLKPRSAPLEGWTATMEVNVRRQLTPARNVVGVLEGKGPLADQTVVIGAHYDHLGYGGQGSLARDKTKKEIHHGADDNASGTTALIELARRFGAQDNRRGRRLVFIAFSGEELGLLGSAHYCNKPLFPLADTVAMVNMDMVGRVRPDKETQKDKLIVYGTGTGKGFDALVDALNAKANFKLQKVPGTMEAGDNSSSDHASFYNKKVPVIFFFTGVHPDYHRPSDTADKINVAGMRRVTDLMEQLVERLRDQPERPSFVQVVVPRGGPRGGAGGAPRLGVMPAYGEDDTKEGMLIEGVTPGGPAAQAGLKDGDRIVEIGGKPVKNLGAYMVMMRTQKRGQPVEVGVLRDGKKITVKVTPQ
jgi:hypothetical protein